MKGAAEHEEKRGAEVWDVPAAGGPEGDKGDLETSFNLSAHSE